MTNPYQPPAEPPRPRRRDRAELDKLRGVARYQRALNLAIVTTIVSAWFMEVNVPGLRLVVVLFMLVSGVGAIVAAFLLAGALHRTPIAVLCALLMFVPGANLITLALLNIQANRRIGVDPAKIR